MKPYWISPAFFAALLAASAIHAHAADISTERTRMPDFCSNRDVNCLIPDGPPRPVAAGTGGGVVVVTPPAGPTPGSGVTPTVQTVPALPGQVPSLFGDVPALPGQVPSFTGGSATGTPSGTAGSVGGATGSLPGSGNVTSHNGSTAATRNAGAGVRRH